MNACFHPTSPKGERGQMTIEMILIMTILLGVSLAISKQMKESGMMKSFVEAPWMPIKGMIEDGVWVKSGDASRALHPVMKTRHGSFDGDEMP